MGKVLGKNIKTARKNKRLTQQELADLIGKSKSVVQKYESGETEPPTPVIYAISDALEIDAYELYDGVYYGWSWSSTTEEERKELEKESDRILLNKIKSLPDIQQAALNVIIEGLIGNSQDTTPDPDPQDTK